MSGLCLEGVTAWHRAGAPVLRDVSLSAERGRVTALLGPNGAGKSSLLRTVLGGMSHRGDVRVDGEPVASLDVRERAVRMAYVPQRTELNAPMYVRDVVAMGRFAHRGPLAVSTRVDRRAVRGAMEQVGVDSLERRLFTQLSGGERRRVLIARALATGAGLLLLDEPTAALDVRQALRLHRILRRLADRGHCVVVVLHDLGEALRVADAAVLLKRGRVVERGPIGEVIRPGPVREVYGVEIREGSAPSFELSAEEG